MEWDWDRVAVGHGGRMRAGHGDGGGSRGSVPISFWGNEPPSQAPLQEGQCWEMGWGQVLVAVAPQNGPQEPKVVPKEGGFLDDPET